MITWDDPITKSKWYEFKSLLILSANLGSRPHSIPTDKLIWSLYSIFFLVIYSKYFSISSSNLPFSNSKSLWSVMAICFNPFEMALCITESTFASESPEKQVCI